MVRSLKTPGDPVSVHNLRPTFRLTLPLPPEEVLRRVREGLADPAGDCQGSMGSHGFELHVDDAHRHFWSPWLTVEVRPDPAGALLYCRFSPQPQVWTLFVAMYSAVGFAALCCLVYASAQWTLDTPPTALWGVPIALLAAGGLYAAAFVGQGLGGAQMYVLRRFLDQHLPASVNEGQAPAADAAG